MDRTDRRNKKKRKEKESHDVIHVTKVSPVIMCYLSAVHLLYYTLPIPAQACLSQSLV